MEKNLKTYSRSDLSNKSDSNPDEIIFNTPKKFKGEPPTSLDYDNDNDDDDDEIDEIVDLASENKRLEQLKNCPANLPATQTVIELDGESSVDILVDNTSDQIPSARPDLDAKSRQLLEPGRMLNDTIIEYYMNYLWTRKLKYHRDSMHLFSTFFFNKIKKLNALDDDKDLSQAVKRWHKNIRLMDKDYLVIPICDYSHWLLVIACFVGQVPSGSNSSVMKSKASLIIFDSLGYKYMTKFTDPIRSFLSLRWHYERPNEPKRNFQDRGLFPEVSAIVPRQKNAYDCGVYLLHFFERFMLEPFLNYNKIIAKRDLSSEWELDSRHKRKIIKSLLVNTVNV